MNNDKTTLDILIDALSEQEWTELKFRAETKKVWQKTDLSRARRESAIQFGDWILKHNVVNGYDMDGSSCWVVHDGKGNTYTYTSIELYNFYITGQWDEINEEDYE
jgi:hypothetical protein